MEPIENNLFSQASSEESATVSGGSYGYYGPTIGFNYNNYLLAVGAFYENAPDVPGNQTALAGTVATPILVRGLTDQEAAYATLVGLGFGSYGYW
ncbi:hypothetical protein [Nostoc sp. TCL26-01]|uniref:hypothetical protein n=1 Tax=Nostoc sp. TCL26-01 TaxID=2576904 RepID=UPI0015BC7A3A|nr:hypothetical protein [Nostoc sp. TCL26-01]QLE56012.1 hypothetical protein FD725_11030 [Nostoc sp. TCL26-01]